MARETYDLVERRIVYVRPVRPDEMPEAAPDIALYAIHDEKTGARLGVAPARELAFLAAREHELTPVSVH